MNKFILYFLILLVVSCMKKEDTGKLHGIVKTDDNRPISNAKILVNNLDSAITNQDGYYEFNTLNSGDYMISAIIGFDTLIEYTSIHEDKIETIDFIINDLRTQFVGKYKCYRKIYAGFSHDLIAEDTSFIEVQYCDSAFNRIIIVADGYNYPPFSYYSTTSEPYFLDSTFADYYYKGQLINFNCLILGNFYSDSIYCENDTDPDCDNWIENFGKKIE